MNYEAGRTLQDKVLGKKISSVNAEADIAKDDFFKGALYFGGLNQSSSGTMRILHWDVFYEAYFCNTGNT